MKGISQSVHAYMENKLTTELNWPSEDWRKAETPAYATKVEIPEEYIKVKS